MEGTPLTRIDGVMIIGMFVGCLSAALWANNVKLRHPTHRIRVFQALAGGIIAGFGARLAMGCNLAAFFTGIPQFSLHAWFFAIATAIGSLAGAKVSLLPIFRIPLNLLKTLGPQGGLLATYLMLGLSLALVIWWEKHFFAKKARQNAAAIARPLPAAV